jgi:hypothetical protein
MTMYKPDEEEVVQAEEAVETAAENDINDSELPADTPLEDAEEQLAEE